MTRQTEVRSAMVNGQVVTILTPAARAGYVATAQANVQMAARLIAEGRVVDANRYLTEAQGDLAYLILDDAAKTAYRKATRKDRPAAEPDGAGTPPG